MRPLLLETVEFRQRPIGHGEAHLHNVRVMGDLG
jgi:hypothetical protein